jgi:hypothetical protein
MYPQFITLNTNCIICIILYFYWQKDKVFVRPTAQVESVQAKRDAEKLAAESLAIITNLCKFRMNKPKVFLSDLDR